MEQLNICEPDEPKATYWLRHAVLGLIALVALLALVLSFAVEFMAPGTALHHRRAHSLLEATQVIPVVDVYASGEHPLRRGHPWASLGGNDPTGEPGPLVR